MTDKLLLNVRLDFVERASKPLISGLLDELMARGVLNQEEVEEVQDKYTVRTDKARCLIDCVRLKGPRASQIFIDSLRKRDGTLAEQLGLATDMGLPGAQLVSPSPLVAIQGQQWIRQCSLSEYQHIRATEGDQIYPLYLPREVRTRRALLICNIDFEHLSRRNGAEVDVQGMTKLLEGLGYAVDIHHNLSSEIAKSTAPLTAPSWSSCPMGSGLGSAGPRAETKPQTSSPSIPSTRSSTTSTARHCWANPKWSSSSPAVEVRPHHKVPASSHVSPENWARTGHPIIADVWLSLPRQGGLCAGERGCRPLCAHSRPHSHHPCGAGG
ncbi:caspase-1-like isoform X2 [Strigops habroptila]|uniref:caspase-1-like isoform X2 n=1 Tax=Strigops habroptila TaxID=2489341 RepID=UPI0011D02BC8|nr:caspase-1-like isoform X2 [Strigops habroptila]